MRRDQRSRVALHLRDFLAELIESALLFVYLGKGVMAPPCKEGPTLV